MALLRRGRAPYGRTLFVTTPGAYAVCERLDRASSALTAVWANEGYDAIHLRPDRRSGGGLPHPGVRRAAIQPADTLTVVPRIDPLPPVQLAGEASGHGESRTRALALAGEDDVIPRGYRHGDDLRRVHWRSTARYGELIVRREEQLHRARCADQCCCGVQKSRQQSRL